MKKLLLVFGILIFGTSINSFAQSAITKIGTYTSFIKGGQGYGGFLEIGNYGISYMKTANLTNDDPTDYILGKANKYTSGKVVTNIGFFAKAHDYHHNINMIIGSGFQFIDNITTNGIESDKSLYGQIGAEYELHNSNFSLRSDIIISLKSASSLNIGVAYKL